MTQAPIQTEQTHPESTGHRSALERTLGALRLDGSAYDEVASDPAALGQAAWVALAAAATRAISAPGGAFSGQGIVFGVLTFALWPVLAALVWGLGRWFGHPADFGRVLRVTGFAMAPLVLLVVSVVPVEFVRVFVALLATALFFAAEVVGTRQALQVTTGRAGFILLVVFMILIFASMVPMYLQSL